MRKREGRKPGTVSFRGERKEERCKTQGGGGKGGNPKSLAGKNNKLKKPKTQGLDDRNPPPRSGTTRRGKNEPDNKSQKEREEKVPHRTKKFWG